VRDVPDDNVGDPGRMKKALAHYWRSHLAASIVGGSVLLLAWAGVQKGVIFDLLVTFIVIVSIWITWRRLR
jgi:hypothetical protein